jgi:hypothetical protein
MHLKIFGRVEKECADRLADCRTIRCRVVRQPAQADQHVEHRAIVFDASHGPTGLTPGDAAGDPFTIKATAPVVSLPLALPLLVDGIIR